MNSTTKSVISAIKNSNMEFETFSNTILNLYNQLTSFHNLINKSGSEKLSEWESGSVPLSDDIHPPKINKNNKNIENNNSVDPSVSNMTLNQILDEYLTDDTKSEDLDISFIKADKSKDINSPSVLIHEIYYSDINESDEIYESDSEDEEAKISFIKAYKSKDINGPSVLIDEIYYSDIDESDEIHEIDSEDEETKISKYL